jgi:Na+-transporting NADH:ubiquinone oxidoreductase subunit NqrE
MSSLIAFIESIPALIRLVELFVDKWQDHQYQKLLKKYDEKSLKRSAIINSIIKAETDDERKTLIRMLYDLNMSN